MLNYEDRIYGAFTINDPLLLDLLETRSVQRLKGVLQHGISGLIGITRPTTRYEHSLGVMLLVRSLGASLQEQAAALLHDVSHTAFSHVIDYVFDGHDTQSYHEDKKEEFIAGSDLPAVLEKHGYLWQDLLHEENFPLLEQAAPALCADRLDYFLRDSFDLKLAGREELKMAIQSLVVHQGRVASCSLEAARWMGYTFIDADQASWANFREVGLYELTARAIKTALHLGVLDMQDLWGTDKEMWSKMQAAHEMELRDLLQWVQPATVFVWDDASPTFRVSTKLRTLDPDVLIDGNTAPLSILDPIFARYRIDYLQSKAGKWPIRVVR
jgi:uncharacterized protein